MDSRVERSEPQAVQTRMRAGDFAGALALLKPTTPDACTETLYLSAVCYRFLRAFDEARACLDRILAAEPEHGHALQELGHLCRDCGDTDTALRVYAEACRVNPSLAASFREQLAILQSRGEAGAASVVAAQLERLQALPQPLIAVTDLLARGRVLRAETLCRRFLQQVPQHVEGMRLLAEIGVRLGALAEAEFLLESAALIEPTHLPARIDYVRVLGRRQKFNKAQEEAARLLAEYPNNVQLRSLHAVECLQAGAYAEALAGFAAVLEQLPEDPVTHTARGHALKTCGDYEEAVSAYRMALASRVHHGEAWYSLANLKIYRFDDNELLTMEKVLATPGLPAIDRVYLSFALGKAEEDRKNYQASFHHYEEGNRLKRAASRYDAAAMSREIAAQREHCSPALFKAKAGAGCKASDPIFIVGMPRAGSTLLEQILSSHSQIDGTQELPNILALSQQLRRHVVSGKTPGYPSVLESLDPDTLRSFGERILDETRIHRQGAPRYIDKMPNNFRHIGLIHLILPNAKIIDARREPMACGFSNFKQLFAEGQEFSYDLADIGHYYRDYVMLMDHWDAVLPGKVLRVQHERVLADLESEVRRLLDFLELPFEPACLRYWETERAVRTPSSEQVRQPIYQDAAHQWAHYEQWLQPLRDALGSNGPQALHNP